MGHLFELKNIKIEKSINILKKYDGVHQSTYLTNKKIKEYPMKIIKNTMKLQTASSPKVIVSIEENNTTNKIKSVRIFEKNNIIHIDYYLNDPFVINAKSRFRFSTKLPNTAENKQQVEERKVSLATEHYEASHNIVVGKMKFKDIAYEAINENASNRTKDINKDYQTILANFILKDFGNRVLSEIKKADIVKWQTDLLTKSKLSKSRYAKYHRTLGFVFKYAFENEIIDKNPFDLVSKKSKLFVENPKDSSKKYYTADEVKMMIENATGWFKVYLTVVLYTGMRSGESLVLQWDDVDFEKETIKIQRSQRRGVLKNTTKTNTIRVIDMPKPVAIALQEYKTKAISNKWMFPNPDTKLPFYEPAPITKSYLKPLLQKLGIEYRTLYATRHTFASICVANNIPLTYVQKQLGHSKLSTTMDFYVKNGLIDAQSRDERIDRLFA